MKYIFVVDNEKFKQEYSFENVKTVTANEYFLMNTKSFDGLNKQSMVVLNLVSDRSYLGLSYYVSLLAMARKHKVLPDTQLIQDLKMKSMHKLYSHKLNIVIQKKLKKLNEDYFELSVYFGKNIALKYDELAEELFKIIRAPIFRVYFYKKENIWDIESVQILTLNDLNESHSVHFKRIASDFFQKKFINRTREKKYLYSLAILVNPEEENPPSNKKALELFQSEGKKIGIDVEFITHKDKDILYEYDALFIRETTSVGHHTYRMARKAEAEGLVVLDDPESIIKCANKIFLEEYLSRLRIKHPKSIIVTQDNFNEIKKNIEYPCVVKEPDSCFSQGVFKAKDVNDLDEIVKKLFKKSDLLLFQEFLKTDFDWRIGVLNNEVIYCCQYFMSQNHWQIINKKTDSTDYGDSKTFNLNEVPQKVLSTALKACKGIGKGLYGVDLKQRGEDIFVIEINDNPNIDYGIEDEVEGKNLYAKIMNNFLERLNKQRGLHVDK